jgi:hypothetical protein
VAARSTSDRPLQSPVQRQQVERQAALLAYGDVFRLVGLVFLLAIPLVLLLGRPQRQPNQASP